MAWIKSDQALRNHPKLHRLMKELGVSKVTAAGHLHMLWWWVMDYAKNGDTSAFSADEIAGGAEWADDPEVFYAALKSSRFMDPDGKIHDWMDYSGQLHNTRERVAKKQKAYRERLANGGSREPHFPEAAIPSWEEFWAYCQTKDCLLPAEWYAKDKFQKAEQADWKQASNWKAYARRVKGWWESDGRPMTPTTRQQNPVKKAPNIAI